MVPSDDGLNDANNTIVSDYATILSLYLPLTTRFQPGANFSLCWPWAIDRKHRAYVAVPSPSETGDPSINEGLTEDHVKVNNAIESYCNNLGQKGDVVEEGFIKEREYEFPVNNMRWPTEIVISLKVWECWKWGFKWDECKRYLRVPADACDCGGKNGKQGGTVVNR